MVKLCLSALLLWAALAAESAETTTTTNEETQESSSSSRPDPIEQCGLFVAESSIVGAGWGLYIGYDIKDGEIMYPTDMAISGPDQPSHMQIRTQILGHPALPAWKINDYAWSPESMGAALDSRTSQATIPGIGTTVNMRAGMINAMIQKPQDVTGEGNDGATTQYHNQYFTAIGDIEAGHELFASYGENWFTGRSHIFGKDFPLSADYKRADEYVTRFEHITNGGIEPYSDDLWKLVKEVLGPEVLSPRTVRALPKTGEDAILRSIPKNTTAYDGLNRVVKSHKWLEENGLCQDHMEAKPSTIPRAGKGAFAKRFLPKGVVAGAIPVVPLSKHHLEMYFVDHSNTVLWQGEQLMMNYVYSNPMTSLVFFPYTSVANYVNHDGKSPNVKLRWSNHPLAEMGKRNIKYADMTPLELLGNVKTFLMEMVALRDIEEGEEIVMDYGGAWQEAWDNHKHPPQEELDQYQSAYTLAKNQKHFLTEVDDPNQTYPRNVQTRCHIHYDANEYSMKDVGGGMSYKVFQWRQHQALGLASTKPCRVRRRQRNADGYRYVVMVEQNQGKNDWVIVTNVFEGAIVLADKPYTKPQYRRDAFRHYIALDDDMIPEIWRDQQQKDTTCSVYMAHSPLGGFNVYTTDKLNPQKSIFSHGDVSIVVEDIVKNMELSDQYHMDGLMEKLPWIMRDYNWAPTSTNSIKESDSPGSVVPGIGMLAQADMGKEANAGIGKVVQTHLLHRADDPGAGASSNNHGLHFLASKEIAEGTEIVTKFLGNPMSPRVNSIMPGGPKKKSVSWIQENGQCLDNLRPGTSSIKQAGHGAFASRAIGEGDVIAPMPVLPMHRRHLEVFESKGGRPQLVGHQQLLNYCYGHSQANILLFPFSPFVNYINHNATKANAKLRWSKHTEESGILSYTPPQLLFEKQPDLVMELVATRPIKRDEEIFIDYGSGWSQAWESHVKEWTPSEERDYVPASVLNDLLEWANVTGPMKKEQVESQDIILMCHVGDLPEEDYVDAGMHGPEWNWKFTPDIFSIQNAKPCDVIKRNEPEDADTRRYSVSPVLLTYDVLVYERPDRKSYKVVKNVPRRGLTFLDAPYRSDMFLRNAFRQEVGLPDDMVPDQWRVL